MDLILQHQLQRCHALLLAEYQEYQRGVALRVLQPHLLTQLTPQFNASFSAPQTVVNTPPKLQGGVRTSDLFSVTSMQQASRVKVEPGMQTPAAQLDGVPFTEAAFQGSILQRLPETVATQRPLLQVPLSASEQIFTQQRPMVTPTSSWPANAGSSSPPNRKTGTVKRSSKPSKSLPGQARTSRPNKLPGYQIQPRQLQQLVHQRLGTQEQQVWYDVQQQQEQQPQRQRQHQQEELFHQFQQGQQQQQPMNGIPKIVSSGQTMSQYLYRHKHDQGQQQDGWPSREYEGQEDQRENHPGLWQQQQWQLIDAGEDQQQEYSPDLGPLPPLLPLNLDSNQEDPAIPSAAEQQHPLHLTFTPTKPQPPTQDPDAALVAMLSPLGHQGLTSCHLGTTSTGYQGSGRHKRLRLSIAESSSSLPPHHTATTAAAAASPSPAAFTPLDVSTATPGKLFTSHGFGSPQSLASPQGFSPGPGSGPMHSPNQPPLGLFSRFGSPLSPVDTTQLATRAAGMGGGGGGAAANKSSSGGQAGGKEEADGEQQLIRQMLFSGEALNGSSEVGKQQQQQQGRQGQELHQEQQQGPMEGWSRQQQEMGCVYDRDAPACSATEIYAARGGGVVQGDGAAGSAGESGRGVASSGWNGGAEGHSPPAAAAGQPCRQGPKTADNLAAAGGSASTAAAPITAAAAASQEESFCAPSNSQPANSQAEPSKHRISLEASCQSRYYLGTPTTWGLTGGESATPSIFMGGAISPSTTGVVTFTPIIPPGFVPSGAATPFGGPARVVGVTSVVRGSTGVLLERNCWDRVVPNRGAGQGKSV